MGRSERSIIWLSIMNPDQFELVELIEYRPRLFPKEHFTASQGEILWRNYSSQVSVEFPTPKTDNQWQLISQGWVGYIQVTPELRIVLHPRVELANLFRMLEYAYRLKSFKFQEGLVDCNSLEEFYEQLAKVLALRTLDRYRKGIYRSYIGKRDQLPYVRGRLDLQQIIQKPWDVNAVCNFEDHTYDNEDNQIIAWTLSRITQSGLCTERTSPTIRKAYRTMQSSVTLQAYSSYSCIRRLYNRLNIDYEQLHALCRLFLEHRGPHHEIGDRKMLPFLVDMTRLYELFVAEWLLQHLPQDIELKLQERIDINQGGSIFFKIDLVLYEASTGNPLCVLDTKYKKPDSPSANDIEQIVAYAAAKQCNEAILVYPGYLANPLHSRVGQINVHSLTFSLDGDLESAGQLFLTDLFKIQCGAAG